MLSAVMLSAIMLSAIMLSVGYSECRVLFNIMLDVECHYAEHHCA